MRTLNEITTRLAEVRKKQGLTQQDMRMLIGMSQQQYQRIETGQDLKVSTLLRILAGLGLTLDFSDPHRLAKYEGIEQRQSDENFWLKKYKHLED